MRREGGRVGGREEGGREEGRGREEGEVVREVWMKGEMTHISSLQLLTQTRVVILVLTQQKVQSGEFHPSAIPATNLPNHMCSAHTNTHCKGLA